MTYSWLEWTKKKVITPIQLDSFLANADNNQPKEWSLNTNILLKYTIKEIKKNHSNESLTTNIIEAAVDKVVSSYERPDKRPTPKEISRVKGYMIDKFRQSAEKSASEKNGTPFSR